MSSFPNANERDCFNVSLCSVTNELRLLAVSGDFAQINAAFISNALLLLGFWEKFDVIVSPTALPTDLKSPLLYQFIVAPDQVCLG